MEDGIFPHLRSLGDPVELEEERRLCYVGITRAERHLYVSHAWSRMLYGRGTSSIPSRFLNEIPDELLRDVGGDPGRFGGGFGRARWGGTGPPLARTEREHRGGASSAAAWPRDRASSTPTDAGAEPRPRAGPSSWASNGQVVHGKWGEGRVVEASGPGEDAEAVVQFGSVGRKKLLLRMAPLKRA